MPVHSAANAPMQGAGSLLQLFRDGRPRTRAALVDASGLARSTVNARLDALLTSGLLIPAGEAESTGGRPPTRFALNPSARVVIAVDLGATHATLAVTDLRGTVLASTTGAIDISDGPETVLDTVVASIGDLLADLGRTGADLAGIGIGVPGPVEHATGRPTNPPIMPGWDGFDLPGHLGRTFPVPVLVDNDVNLMALGEHVTRWPDVAHLLFVKVSTGIGAGIISDYRLNRGAQGTAGDLGHVHVPGHSEKPCRCGNLGCLEAVAAGPAVAALLRERGLEATNSADVVDHVRAGDVAAIQIVRQAGRDLGGVLATCVNLLNPSLIVIGGKLADSGEHLLAGVRESVYLRSLPLATQNLRIVTSGTGDQAGVLGAAAMVIDAVLAPEAVDRTITERAATG